MLCRAQNVFTGSLSAYFNIAMICSSLNRLRFFSFCSFFLRAELHFFQIHFSGVRSVGYGIVQKVASCEAILLSLISYFRERVLVTFLLPV
jgi:hypothetical protein